MRKSSLGRRNSNRPSSAAGRTSVDINNASRSSTTYPNLVRTGRFGGVDACQLKEWGDRAAEMLGPTRTQMDPLRKITDFFDQVERTKKPTAKSGIPVARQQRARSTERQGVSGMHFLDRMQRTNSLHHLAGDMPLMTPSTTPLLSRRLLASGGTERPARTTSYGTPSVSVGSSSIGGQKNKRDNRPLQDKEWQAKAIEFIEDVVQRHPDGHNVLGGSLKSLTLAKFLDVCDLLLKMLHPTININKANYIKELPFLLQKKMLYKGKVEKSWMVVVSTPHAIPFAIGVLEFLAHCVNNMCSVDIDSLMFPLRFDGDGVSSSLPEMNFQLLVPYLNLSFEMFNMKSNCPDYEAKQQELDNDVMRKHYEQEDGLAQKEAILSELDRVQAEYDKITHDRNLIVQQTEALQNEYRSIEHSIKQDEEKMANCKIAIPSYHTELAEIGRKTTVMVKEGEKWAEELEQLQKKAQEQPITLRDVENIKKKRDSIDREIVSSKKYIKSYQDMIFTEDLEIVQLKTQIEELTRETNLKAMMYVPVEPQFEVLTLPTKLEEIVLPLKEEDFGTLNIKYTALSSDYKSARATAGKERDQVEKNTKEQKALIVARRDQLLARKAQCDVEVERLNHERQAKEEQLERTKFEVETLEKQEKQLRAKIEAKKEQVAKEKKNLEEGEAVMLEAIRDMEARVERHNAEKEVWTRAKRKESSTPKGCDVNESRSAILLKDPREQRSKGDGGELRARALSKPLNSLEKLANDFADLTAVHNLIRRSLDAPFI